MSCTSDAEVTFSKFYRLISVGKRPLPTDEYEISAGWGMEVLALGADNRVSVQLNQLSSASDKIRRVLGNQDRWCLQL